MLIYIKEIGKSQKHEGARQRFLPIKSFCGGIRGAVFSKRAPLVNRKKIANEWPSL
jgi:hypothetical protein